MNWRNLSTEKCRTSLLKLTVRSGTRTLNGYFGDISQIFIFKFRNLKKADLFKMPSMRLVTLVEMFQWFATTLGTQIINNTLESIVYLLKKLSEMSIHDFGYFLLT